jgi:hypothetical protein
MHEQMMQTLLLEPGDLLQTKSTDLPPGQFIKLQPQDTNFLDISDPKAVLETAFRNFSCLSEGDIFTFLYNETTYEIAVLEVKPKGRQEICQCTRDGHRSRLRSTGRVRGAFSDGCQWYKHTS